MVLKHISVIFRKDNIIGATTNLTNSVIGLGLVFLPFMLKTNGIMFGLLALVFGCFLSWLSKHLICQVLHQARKEGKRADTLEKIGGIVFGEWADYFIKFIMILYLSGGIIAYQAIMKNSFVNVLVTTFPEVDFFQSSNFYFIVSVGGIIFLNVVSLGASFRNLRYVGVISLGVLYTLIIFVVFLFFIEFTAPIRRGNVKFMFNVDEKLAYPYLLMYFGVITLSYGSTTFTVVHAEFETKNLWKVVAVNANYHIFSLIIYATVAIFGYLSFLGSTENNFVLGYGNFTNATGFQRTIGIFLQFLIFIQMVLCTPPQTYRLGLSLYNLVVELKEKITNKKRNTILEDYPAGMEDEKIPEGIREERKQIIRFKFWIVSTLKFIAILSTGLVAYFYPDSLGIVSYLGCVLGTPVSHLFQQIMFLKYVKTHWIGKVFVFGVFIFTVIFIWLVPGTLKVLQDRGIIHPPN